jgi:dynein heavy chain
VCKDTDAEVRNMAVALPLVNELHSPSMRPRHWKELARVCGVKALDPSDAKFCLEDLLALHLHTHKEEVEEIVDAATKEQKIERKMDEIESVWRTSALDYLPHKDGDVKVVRASDEIMENLDAHQMELQSIVSMGKVMEFFRDRVEASQRSLGIVEEVLKEWLSVTKAWASLESIFLASADIRAQLPDDTKRFEGIDSGFKELMKSAVETPNVVEACTKEGRGDSLREMTRNLELCQKSLNDYLDTKKKIFPRFYFVSNVALLEILSNGNAPRKIMPFLGACARAAAAADTPPLLRALGVCPSIYLPTLFPLASPALLPLPSSQATATTPSPTWSSMTATWAVLAAARRAAPALRPLPRATPPRCATWRTA